VARKKMEETQTMVDDNTTKLQEMENEKYSGNCAADPMRLELRKLTDITSFLEKDKTNAIETLRQVEEELASTRASIMECEQIITALRSEISNQTDSLKQNDENRLRLEANFRLASSKLRQLQQSFTQLQMDIAELNKELESTKVYLMSLRAHVR